MGKMKAEAEGDIVRWVDGQEIRVLVIIDGDELCIGGVRTHHPEVIGLILIEGPQAQAFGAELPPLPHGLSEVTESSDANCARGTVCEIIFL